MVYAALATQFPSIPAPSAWANQVKANFDAGPNALVSAAGDIVYATGAGALARLAAGATGAVLTIAGGVPVWSPASTTANPVGAAGGSLAGTYPNPTIAAGAVGTAQVAAGTYGISITGAAGGAPPTGAAGGSLAGTFPNPTIAAGAIGTTELGAGAVTNGKIANNAVDANKIALNTLVAAHFAAGAVDTAAIGALVVTTAKIADANVTSPKLSLATSAGNLASDTTLNNTSYTDLVSLSLAAGTWLLFASVTFDPSATAGGTYTSAARLRNDTAGAVLKEGTLSSTGTTNTQDSVTVFHLVTLGGTSTIKLQGASGSNSMKAKATAQDVGPGAPGVPGTHLLAIRIG